MTRGKIRPTTANEARLRALSQIYAVPTPPAGAPFDGGHRPIAYRKEDYNGGKDPYALHCADWSYGERTPTADCIGFMLWASGLDRLQPDYKGTRGEYLNCGSLLDDADGAQAWCKPVAAHEAQVGDWLMTPDHCGLIIRPACLLPNGAMVADHLVVDCSPRHGWNTAINTGAPWSTSCRVVRYQRYQTIVV